MDLFGLGTGQVSSSTSDSDSASGEDQAHQPANVPQDSSEDSSEDSDDSLDSTQQRALAADARLKDHGADVAGVRARAGVGPLPSVDDAFDEVEGPPGFLDPEATRPIATSSVHGLTASYAAPSAAQPTDPSKVAGKDFDIARLAPLMKGQKREGEELRGPPGAVIEAKAKRTKAEDAVQYTDLQVAMMGGNVASSRQAGPAGAGPSAPGPSLPPSEEGAKGKAPSKAMDVAEFLNKGEGTALMPRKAQDRKDKEKLKRQKGQTSVHGWKTEAEMVLRQQFDS